MQGSHQGRGKAAIKGKINGGVAVFLLYNAKKRIGNTHYVNANQNKHKHACEVIGVTDYKFYKINKACFVTFLSRQGHFNFTDSDNWGEQRNKHR